MAALLIAVRKKLETNGSVIGHTWRGVLKPWGGALKLEKSTVIREEL